MTTPKIRKRKTFLVRFTKFELVHLRDLFSIVLPPEGRQTVSQALAIAETRPIIEARLWQKVVTACEEAELPMGDEAPDFLVSAAAVPTLGVFRVADEPDQQPDSDDDEDGEEGQAPGPFGDEDE